MSNFNFYITDMPASRPADYYIGCLDGSVYMDFNNCKQGQICLVRISFNSYGCCSLKGKKTPLNQENSATFKEMLGSQTIDQDVLEELIKKAISLNKSLIWTDALEHYKLI